MRSVVRRGTLALAFLAGALIAAAPPAAAAGRVLVIALPEGEARALLARRPAAVGLGVYPPTRRATAFVEEIGGGGPRGTSAPEEGRGPGALRRALERAGVIPQVVAGKGTPPALASSLARAFGEAPADTATPAGAGMITVTALALARAQDAETALAGFPGRAIVLGVGERTPVLVADLSLRGLLRAGKRPRPAVLTPYDVAVTVLRAAGAEPGPGAIGRALVSVPSAAPLARLDALAARFERDEATRFALTVAQAAAVFGSLLAGGASLALRRRREAVRWAQAATLGLAGYTGALFVPSGGAWVRVLPVAMAAAAGFAIPPRFGRRVCAGALLGVAASLAALAVVAALRPLGEPALSLWGPPLQLWRFFGLLNHLVAFIIGGAVAGAALARVRTTGVAALATSAAGVAAAPTVGANYVSVVWIAVAGSVAIGVARDGRLRLRHALAGAAIGTAGFAAALAAARALGVSHGAGALTRILDDGPAALWDLVSARAALNWRHLLDQPGWFIAWDAFVVACLIAGILWTARGRGVLGEAGPREGGARVGPRAAVAGCAVAALVALIVEDTGTLMVSSVAAFAGIAFLIDRAAPDG